MRAGFSGLSCTGGLNARPGGIIFEKPGRRIFVNLNGATKLGLLDRKKRGDRAAEVQVYEPWICGSVGHSSNNRPKCPFGPCRPIFVTDSAHK
jgi:hypothetical protein